MSPEHRRFFHKKDIESFLGRTLESKVVKKKEDDASPQVRMRYVTDDDAIPSWSDSLPEGWRVAFRQLPGGLHKIYVPPNQEKGFVYQGADVPLYLKGEKSLSLFGSSRPMATRPNKKRSRSKREKELAVAHYASPADYVEAKDFTVMKLPLPEKERAKLSPEVEKLLGSSKEIHDLLVQRKFKEVEISVFFSLVLVDDEFLVFQCYNLATPLFVGTDLGLPFFNGAFPTKVELCGVFHKQNHENKIMEAVTGIFYRRPEEFSQKPYFQKISTLGQRFIHVYDWCLF